jgi:phosphonate transport system permease protein
MIARRAEGPLARQARADRAALEARFPGVFRPSPARRAVVAALVGAGVALFMFGLWRLDFSPGRILAGLGRLGDFVPLMLPPNPQTWARAAAYLWSLVETLSIAFLGTLGAALIAFPLALLAARTVVPAWFLRWPARRLFNAISGVDALIWALIWINVVGLGPFAGVLAIMTSDIGSFTKLYSEAIEAVDRKPGEGVLSTGGSRLQSIRFGIVPQVMPVLISQTLYYFESNTRSATIIGIVGAGGIGLFLAEMIRTFEWDQVAFIVLMVLVTVAIIDFVSARLRHAIIGTSLRNR